MKTSNSFFELVKTELVLEALDKINFQQPTEIQAQAIPIIQRGRDLIACAQTGTGKTAAFCLPIIDKLTRLENENALILTPTREIASQITDFLKSVLHRNLQLRLVLLIGGHALEKQTRALKKQPRIIVATPGRLNDHLKRRALNLESFTTLILDEADRMLDMGFAPQLRTISNYLPRNRQTLLFSATIQGETKELAQRFLTKPLQLTIGKPSQPISKIHQINIETEDAEKIDRLMDELNQRQGSKLIFVKTRSGVERLFNTLKGFGYKLGRIHGERTQTQRNTALSEFSDGTHSILVATDVAARGIDISNIGQVINFDPPQMTEDYIHRIGRTARAGKSGEALNLITPKNTLEWLEIFEVLKGKGPKRPISPKLIAEAHSSRPKIRTKKKKSNVGSSGPKLKTHKNKPKKKVTKKRSISSTASRDARAKDKASSQKKRRRR